MTIDHISQANVPFYPYLPMGVTNFGGDTQIFTIDPQSTAPIGCALNPQGLAVLNGAYNQPILNNWGYTPSTDNPFMTGMQQTGERVSKPCCSNNQYKLANNCNGKTKTKRNVNDR